MSKIEDIYGMARGWMDHELLASNEPFDKRLAWCWLIEHAAWKSYSRKWRHDRPAITMQRGQLFASVRFMAGKWRWSTNRAARFLKVLSSAGMIDIKTNTGICLITINNYNDYQLTPGFKKDATGDAGGDSDGDIGGDNKENKDIRIQKENKDKEYQPPNPRKRGKQAPLIDDLPTQFKEPCRFESEFWPLCPIKGGKTKAKAAYAKARTRDTQANIIKGMRAYRLKYLADDRPPEEKDRFFKWPQGWLNDDRWRDFTESAEPDEDKMPEGMTPAEHAAWNLRRIGHV